MESNRLEKQEGPKIKFDFLFSAHLSTKDTEKLKDKIQKCDVYAPEFIIGQVPPDIIRVALNELSQGYIAPEDFISTLAQYDNRVVSIIENFPFLKTLLESVYQSKKKILSIDVTDAEMEKIIESDPEAKEKVDQLRKGPSFGSLVEQGNVGEALDKFRIYTEGLTKVNVIEREKIVIQKLKKELADLSEKDLILKNLPQINVFISFGSVHTTLGHALKSEGYEVTREFNKMPYVYTVAHETMRRIIFGKEIPEDAYKRGLAEMMVVRIILQKDREKNTEDVYNMARKFISSLTLAEVEEFLKDFSKQESEKILEQVTSHFSK